MSHTDFVTYLQTNDRHACELRSKRFSNACLQNSNCSFLNIFPSPHVFEVLFVVVQEKLFSLFNGSLGGDDHFGQLGLLHPKAKDFTIRLTAVVDVPLSLINI